MSELVVFGMVRMLPRLLSGAFPRSVFSVREDDRFQESDRSIVVIEWTNGASAGAVKAFLSAEQDIGDVHLSLRRRSDRQTARIDAKGQWDWGDGHDDWEEARDALFDRAMRLVKCADLLPKQPSIFTALPPQVIDVELEDAA